MRFITAPFLLSTLLLAPPAAVSQPLTGRIVEAGTNAPIGGARVFVDRTTIGTVSDADGRFEIIRPPQSSFTIVAHAEGYALGELGAGLATGSSPLELALTGAPGAADVALTAPAGEQPAAALSRLKDALFTRSSAGRSCTIVNPEALRFESTDEGSVRASAAAPLVIEHGTTGYRSTWFGFLADGPVYSPRLEGRVFFEDMAPEGKPGNRQRSRRKDAYRTSFRHFVKSLVDGRLSRALFGAYFVEVPGSTFDGRPVPEMGRNRYGDGAAKPVLRDGSTPGTHVLIFNGWMYVRHPDSDALDEQFVEQYWPVSNTRDLLLGQAGRSGSWLNLTYSSVTVDATGVLLEYPEHDWIRFEGAMGLHRLDRLLPNDYDPD